MGMDLHSTKNDLAFRRSCWGWRPLWDCAEFFAPELIDARLHKAGHFNDGAGLDGEKSCNLAAILRDRISDGTARKYVEQRQASIRALPDEVCDICGGTGKRTDMVVAHGCNKCRGDGKVRPVAVNYCLDLEDLVEFADFLDQCGGFSID